MNYFFSNNQYPIILKILIFVYSLIPNHENLLIYSFIDNKKRIFSSSLIEDYKGPIYMIHPFKGPYQFIFNNNTIELFTHISDSNKLYPYIDKDVFEYVFHLELKIDNSIIFDSFMKSCFEHYNNIFHNDCNENFIHIYHYSDYWERFQDIPRRNISTIYLPKNQSQNLLNDINHFLSKETKDLYQQFGVPYHKTYCLYGPPGSGKTSLIQTIASEIQRNMCIIRFNQNTKDLDVANAIKWIPKNSILILEDIDCLLQNRDDINGNISFSGLLNILDGLSTTDSLVTFLTTNFFMKLDDALKRPGRIDYILEFSFVNLEQIQIMLSKFYPNEINDAELIYDRIKNKEMTVSHIQKLFFSLYPNGNVLNNIDTYINEYNKYYNKKSLSHNLYL